MRAIFVCISFCLNHGGYSLEPKCSKFAYDEQLLEKMIRIELSAEMKEKANKAERDEITKTLAALSNRIENLEADRNGLRGMVQSGFEIINQNVSNQLQLFEQLLTGFNQSSWKRGPVIAFRANTAKNKKPNKGETIVFTTVTMNEGGAYDKDTGKFTAPVDGVYFFHDQLCLKVNMDFYHSFVVDDTEMSRERYINSDSEAPLCFTAVFTQTLKAGQKVYVRCKYVNKGGDGLVDDTYRINLFYGLLVREN